MHYHPHRLQPHPQKYTTDRPVFTSRLSPHLLPRRLPSEPLSLSSLSPPLLSKSPLLVGLGSREGDGACSLTSPVFQAPLDIRRHFPC